MRDRDQWGRPPGRVPGGRRYGPRSASRKGDSGPANLLTEVDGRVDTQITAMGAENHPVLPRSTNSEGVIELLTRDLKQKPVRRRLLAAFILAFAIVVCASSAALADAYHRKGGRQSNPSTDLYAASAGLNAKTGFGPTNGGCVVQALTVSELTGSHQTEVGLARCNNQHVDGTCAGGYKYIEIELNATSYQCYQKGAFVDNHIYPGSVSSSAGDSYTSFKGVIDGETVSFTSPFGYQSNRDSNAMGEALGNAGCSTSTSVTMAFTNWTKYTLSGGGAYLTGNPFMEGTICFQGGTIDSTGDFSVTLY